MPSQKKDIKKDESRRRRKDSGGVSSGNQPVYKAIFSGSAFPARWSCTVIVFLIALFFIIAITGPALYINDEWITANQLHQLDIGHQVVVNEAKYGATANGSISLYFLHRNNVLLYSLALPVVAMPVVKFFGIFSDNFRLAVILGWSMIPIFVALLLEAAYPKFRKLWGIRLSVIAILLGVALFVANVLLYKQFPYSAADAPYEVAALVLTNHILFALTAAVIFEAGRLIFRDIGTSIFSVFACISCSSILFWAGTGKDHVLTAAVCALIVLFWIRYLYNLRWVDAMTALLFTGLLLWVRPEVGLVVSIMLVLFLAGIILPGFLKKSISLKQALISVTSASGIIVGAIPFFLNNMLLTGSFLTPVWIAPQLAVPIMTTTHQVPGAVSSAAANSAGLAPAALAQPLSKVPAVVETILSRFGPLTPETARHLLDVLTFPQNQGFGFLVMCPLIPLALLACVLWWTDVRKIQGTDRLVLLFLIAMTIAVICSYIPEMGVLDVHTGTPPDMRYIMPAYIPAGLFSLIILKQTPLLSNPGNLLKPAFLGSLILPPLFIAGMIILHPFGVQYAGYTAFFKFLIILMIIICCLGMIMSRGISKFAYRAGSVIPIFMIVLIITVLAFQLMLAFVIGDAIKFNGYPLWIPVIRTAHGMIFRVTTLPV